MKDKCESAYDQLASLENIRQRLEHDLQDKTEALKIDSDQLGLTERSTGLSFKPDPLKVPNGSVQPDAWQDHSVQVSSNTSVFRFSKRPFLYQNSRISFLFWLKMGEICFSRQFIHYLYRRRRNSATPRPLFCYSKIFACLSSQK